MPTPSRSRPIIWILVAIAIPWALFVASLSSDFYNLTSPPEFGLHVVMRKIYSVGAFALVGYLIARALGECGWPLGARTVITLGAVYSGAIEVAQYYVGSQEGIWWNLFDIGCGAVGGAIAARILGRSKGGQARDKPVKRFTRSRRVANKRTIRLGDDSLCETPRKAKIAAPRR